VDRYLGVAFLFALIVLVLADTLLRAFHLTPFMGTMEIVRAFLIWSVYIALRYVHSEDAHIRMGELVSYLPETVRAALRIIIELTAVAAFALITASMLSCMIHNARDTTPTLEIPLLLFFLPTFLGFLLATIQSGIVLGGAIREARIIFRKGSPRIPGHAEDVGD